MLVEAVDVHYTYRTSAEEVHALAGVSLLVQAGEVAVITGPSGCGKTTLLNLLAGLDVADSGTVRIANRSLSDLTGDERTEVRLRGVGMIFQENNLIAQLSAAENVELILRFQGEEAPRGAASRLLASVGIEHLANRMPGDMSGGQRQRVGIARALAGGRAVVLCDEPTGALDSGNSRALFGLFRELADESQCAIVVATHDPIARDFADRTLSMVDGRFSS